VTQAILDTAVESSNQKGVPKPTELAEQKEDNRKAFLDNHDPLEIVADYSNMADDYRMFTDRMELLCKIIQNCHDEEDWTSAVPLLCGTDANASRDGR